MAKMKNPHNVKETFIKPSALEMVKAVMGEEGKKLQKNCNGFLCQTMLFGVKLIILELEADILNQIVSDIKASSTKISVQLDELTYVSNCSQLTVFACYVKGNTVEEQFLF